MSDTRSVRDLSTLTEQVITKRLQGVAGVGQVRVNGKTNRQMLVNLKPDALAGQNVGVDEVLRAIQATNANLPAGNISYGAAERLVRVEGKIKDARGFNKIIVARRASGPVYLEQVAEIVDGEQEETSISRINGARAITLEVTKVQDANVVEVGTGIKAAVEKMQKTLPADIKLEHHRRPVAARAEPARQRQEDHHRRRDADDADRVPVPAFVAQHHHHRPDPADLGDGQLHRDEVLRLHAQLPDPDGAVAVHRPADRRRHRGAREHRAPPRHGQEPHAAPPTTAPTRSAWR